MRYDCKLGIGLVPRKSDQDRIYQLVEVIEENTGLGFKTEPGVSTPHTTIFQGRFEGEAGINQIVESLDITGLDIPYSATGISIWAQKILFLDIPRTEKIAGLHYETFAKAFSLCAGKPADTQKLEGITAAEQRSFSRTGSPFVGDSYQPHFTLGHLVELPADPTRVERELTQLISSYLTEPLRFESVVNYEVGAFGACKRIVYERSLRSD